MLKKTLLFVLFSLNLQAQGLPFLPVQDGGRLKPFDTFARESLKLVFGSTTYRPMNKNGASKKEAWEVVFTWMLVPQEWEKTPFFLIRHSGVREYLKLDKKRLYYSPQEIQENERLPLLMQELQTKRSQREKLNPFYQAAQTLENQLLLFHAIAMGAAIRVLPQRTRDSWLAVNELQGEWQERFQKITSAFVKSIQKEGGPKNSVLLEQAVSSFIKEAQKIFPKKYADMAKIRLEVHYNSFHPFMWAWIVLLVGFLFLVFSLLSEKSSWTYKSAWGFSLLGMALMIYGMGIRVFLAGRPPVSNMYETVIWVSFGTLLFGMILEKIYKYKIILLAAQVVSILCLIISDLSPAVLDPSLQPLQPVLRDTFWLTTHVLIITLSYAAFFLAFLLGDLVLVYYLISEERFKDRIKQGVQMIYRAMQIGVVLVAAGTILGGIWADYSWGRFWGWDPKETWAFITLMGYLAVLHARLIGLIRELGMAVSAVLAFSLVLMAWYGVNFVLGAGLHTYGFGAGGVEYVAGFVILHVLFVTYVLSYRHFRKKQEMMR
ncbi:MAG: cytochrome C biogenesis protein [Bdellovibrio sp.]|nr:MAG: cytochrome C biogenesis protein [Bdellovibrio sp.]